MVCATASVLFATACGLLARKVPSLNSLIVESLGARNGVLVVFAPTSCKLTSRDFVTLNRIAAFPGLHVRGVVLVSAPEDASAREYAAPFGIGFPVEFDDQSIWQETFRANQMSGSLMAFVRDGQVQALLWAEAAVSVKSMPFGWDSVGRPIGSDL
jgi:hypothetical protein